MKIPKELRDFSITEYYNFQKAIRELALYKGISLEQAQNEAIKTIKGFESFRKHYKNQPVKKTKTEKQLLNIKNK